jgi:hypothetical protein
MFYVTAAAGRRPGFGTALFYQPTMATRATAMIGLAQGRRAIIFLSVVALLATEFLTFNINPFAALVILDMMTDSTPVPFKGFGMNLM